MVWGGGVVVGEERVAEYCDGEGGFQGGEVRGCYALVVVQNGEFDGRAWDWCHCRR